MDNSTIALIIAAVTMVLYATNVISVSVTSLLSALAMAFFGIISVADAFSGFTSTAVLLIIVLFINLLTKILAKKFDVSKLD